VIFFITVMYIQINVTEIKVGFNTTFKGRILLPKATLLVKLQLKY